MSRIHKYKFRTIPALQLEVRTRTGLRMGHKEDAVRTPFDAQILEEPGLAISYCAAHAHQHAARGLRPVLINLGSTSGCFPVAAHPSQISRRRVACGFCLA